MEQSIPLYFPSFIRVYLCSSVVPFLFPSTSHQSAQYRVRIRVILPLLASPAILERFPSLDAGHATAGFDGSSDLARDGRRQLHKLAARPFEREAVLIFSARWIWPQRGNASSILNFICFRAPLVRRSIALWRKPPLDVPAIVRHVLWFKTQLDHFAQQLAVGVAVFPFPANPVQPRPSPHRAVIRLAQPVVPACQRKLARHGSRRSIQLRSAAGSKRASPCGPS